MPDTGLSTTTGLAATAANAAAASSLVNSHKTAPLSAHSLTLETAAVTSGFAYRRAGVTVATASVEFDANNSGGSVVQRWVPAYLS